MNCRLTRENTILLHRIHQCFGEQSVLFSRERPVGPAAKPAYTGINGVAIEWLGRDHLAKSGRDRINLSPL